MSSQAQIDAEVKQMDYQQMIQWLRRRYDDMYNTIQAQCRAADQDKAEIARLRTIVDKFPKTADGVPLRVGMKVYCPLGHEHMVYPSSPIGGQIYCTENGCWSECGGHRSGTYYNDRDCSSIPPAATKSEVK